MMMMMMMMKVNDAFVCVAMSDVKKRARLELFLLFLSCYRRSDVRTDD
jgi:hypothetical protein